MNVGPAINNKVGHDMQVAMQSGSKQCIIQCQGVLTRWFINMGCPQANANPRIACVLFTALCYGGLTRPAKTTRPLAGWLAGLTRTREILRLSRCVEQFMGMLGHTAVPPVPTAPILPAEACAGPAPTKDRRSSR